MTPDSDNLKAAAEYLLQVARSSEGRRYRKQPKMDALREYKAEIVEAHRSGLNVHRIAEIFRERGVDISKIHLMRPSGALLRKRRGWTRGLVKSEK